VLRGDDVTPAGNVDTLKIGDRVFVIAPATAVDTLNRVFIAPHHPDRLEEHKFFGDLVLDADANVEDIASFYGVEMPPAAKGLTLGGYLQRVFHKRPSVG